MTEFFRMIPNDMGDSTVGQKIIFPGFIPQPKSKRISSLDSLENPESIRLFTRPNWPTSARGEKLATFYEFAPHCLGHKDASTDFTFHTIFNMRAESESSENSRWIRFFKRPNWINIKGVRAIEDIDVK